MRIPNTANNLSSTDQDRDELVHGIVNLEMIVSITCATFASLMAPQTPSDATTNLRVRVRVKKEIFDKLAGGGMAAPFLRTGEIRKARQGRWKPRAIGNASERKVGDSAQGGGAQTVSETTSDIG